jgi:hypothetical protein
MGDPYLVLTPLLVAVIFLLVRFIGCANVIGIRGWNPIREPGEPGEPETVYPPLVLDPDISVVAYWPLQEPQGTAPGDTAENETGFINGTYQSSTLAGGILTLGAEGMLVSENSTSMEVDGGYVEVPFDSTLNTPEFAIEALVRPGWIAPEGVYRTVVESVGDGPPGIAIYSGPEDPQNPIADVWQVWVGDGTAFQQVNAFVLGTSPPVAYATPTYLLVTGALNADTTITLKLFVYTPGVTCDPLSPTVAAWTAIAAYTPNTSLGAPLRIGMGRAAPGSAPSHPFKGRIQDVAVYNKALAESRVCEHVSAAFQPPNPDFGP